MAPFFSILTPSFNQAEFIQKNIASVCEQHHPSVEHIVIDGGSSDATVSILQSHAHLRWLSEKDQGQADALNKGLHLAQGEVVGWINSDDYYLPGAFAVVEAAFQDPKVNWVIGKLITVNEQNEETNKYKFESISFEKLRHDADLVTQASAFYRTSFLRQLGGFDSSLRMVMDYDLWLRCAQASTPVTIDCELAAFRIHAQQKTSTKNILLQMREIVGVQKKYGVSAEFIALTKRKKYWSLTKQILKQWLPKS